MQSLKSETDNALQRAEELDKEAKEATQRAEKYEENVSEEEFFFPDPEFFFFLKRICNSSIFYLPNLKNTLF